MHIWRKTSSRVKTPVALTIGNFDGVHKGHQAMLKRLQESAKILGLPACVMTFEPHPREFFSPDQAPTRLTGVREKLQCLIQANVDRVYICRFDYAFAKMPPEQFITRILNKELNVRWLLVGDDFRFGARRAGDITMLQTHSAANGYTVEIMPNITVDDTRVSSTVIRQALANGDLAAAGNFLGRPFSMSGRIIDGDKLGKKIGFPTANIQLKHNRPVLSGIFAVSARGAITSSPMTPLPGVASLGVRPTTHQNGSYVLEVHLFDFNQEIYGQRLQVDFLHKLRDEQKFSDINALILQIEKDIVQTKNYFMTKTNAHNYSSICIAH